MEYLDLGYFFYKCINKYINVYLFLIYFSHSCLNACKPNHLCEELKCHHKLLLWILITQNKQIPDKSALFIHLQHVFKNRIRRDNEKINK